MIDERDRKDYFVPPASLFSAHCDCVVDRYGLADLIRKETVEDICFGYVDRISQTEKVFTIRTSKATYYSRAAVLAVGPGSQPGIPGMDPGQQHEAATHAMHIDEFPSSLVRSRIALRKPTNALIVGGGLTSAQLADLALRRGMSRVWLVIRGPLRVKPFDVNLEWIGKFRNVEQAAFWSADSDEERWEKIKTARGGGSITPPYKKILDQHVAEGRLIIKLHTTIAHKTYDTGHGTWDVTLATADPADRTMDSEQERLPPIDHIYYATGLRADVNEISFLKSMLKQYPIASCGGLPCITEDMMWGTDIPLFVTGRLAALQLGPGAGNLVGARIGAERVSWALQELLETKDEPNLDSNSRLAELDYIIGRGGRFQALSAVTTE